MGIKNKLLLQEQLAHSGQSHKEIYKQSEHFRALHFKLCPTWTLGLSRRWNARALARRHATPGQYILLVVENGAFALSEPII